VIVHRLRCHFDLTLRYKEQAALRKTVTGDDAMNRARSYGAVVCCVFLIAGTRGTEVSGPQIDQFQKGVSTIVDVETKLGMPQKTGPLANGDTAADYILLQESANGASYVPFARLAAGAMNVHEVRVEFEFNPAGHLVDVQTSQRDLVCPHRVCTDEQKSEPWTPAPAQGD
jgi:hypothetical protein